jgi:hypothetical protein
MIYQTASLVSGVAIAALTIVYLITASINNFLAIRERMASKKTESKKFTVIRGKFEGYITSLGVYSSIGEVPSVYLNGEGDPVYTLNENGTVECARSLGEHDSAPSDTSTEPDFLDVEFTIPAESDSTGEEVSHPPVKDEKWALGTIQATERAPGDHHFPRWTEERTFAEKKYIWHPHYDDAEELSLKRYISKNDDIEREGNTLTYRNRKYTLDRKRTKFDPIYLNKSAFEDEFIVYFDPETRKWMILT